MQQKSEFLNSHDEELCSFKAFEVNKMANLRILLSCVYIAPYIVAIDAQKISPEDRSEAIFKRKQHSLQIANYFSYHNESTSLACIIEYV